jgi:predicted AAA+ superfamily ATPase
MYYNRHADEAINKLSKMFGAVLVTGARQVGKTTILSEVAKNAEENIGYVTLDDKIQLINAIEQSTTFFKDNPPPVFVDEFKSVDLIKLLNVVIAVRDRFISYT